MGKDVIVACDMPDRASVMAFLDRFGDERPYVCLLYTSDAADE